MAEGISPHLQHPTKCDFGPFSSGICGQQVVIAYRSDFIPPVLNYTVKIGEVLTIVDALADVLEAVEAENLNSGAYKKTFFKIRNDMNGAWVQSSETTNPILVTFTPPDTMELGVHDIEYVLELNDGSKVFGKIRLNVLEADVVAIVPTAGNFTYSISDHESKTITLFTKVTVDATTAVDKNTLVISNPSEGAISTIDANTGKIRFVPDISVTSARTITFTYKVSDQLGQESNEATVTINVSDYAPTAKDINLNKLDTDPIVINLNNKVTVGSGMSINKSTYVLDGLPTEGVHGFADGIFEFVPDASIGNDRTITFTYKVNDSKGFTTNTATVTINLEDYNIYQNSVLYGNSTQASAGDQMIEDIDDIVTQEDYPGTYEINYENDTDYKWICFPKAWGIPIRSAGTHSDGSPMINGQDANTGFDVPMIVYYHTVGGVELICLRSLYPLGDSFRIKLV